MGDKSHTVTTRVDQSGFPETVETFTNIDEGNYQTLLCSHVKKKMSKIHYRRKCLFPYQNYITVVFITGWIVFGVTLREITLIKNLYFCRQKERFWQQLETPIDLTHTANVTTREPPIYNTTDRWKFPARQIL